MVFILEFEWKRKWLPVVVGFAIFMGTVVVVTELGIGNGDFLYFLTVMIFVIIVWSIEGKKRQMWVVITLASLTLLEAPVTSIFLLISRIGLEEIYNRGVVNIISNSSGILVIFLIFWIKKAVKFSVSTKMKLMKSRYLVMIIISSIAVVMYLAPILVLGLKSESSYIQKLFAVGFSLSGIAMMGGWVFITILNDSKRAIKFELDANQVMIQQQEAYYIALLEKEVETKRFRHDVNGHLLCMHHMLEDEKIMELNSYLMGLLTDVQALKSGVQTGNDIINCVINDILSKNDSERFDFKWKGLFPQESKIAPIDLCTIFSNLLNNAIEAVLSIDNKEKAWIRITIKNHNESLVICMENNTAHKVEIKNNQLTTTKKDKHQHGFGSQNVQKAVAKYGGEITYSSEEHIFLVEIIFRDIL